MKMMMMEEQADQETMEARLRPRLCYLSKGGRGYGFHLHGEGGAQLVRRVEAGSPAELAGLRSGDRVVEVNGENVENHSHQQVVQRIMAVESRTRLLVVDEETDDFLRRHFLPCTEDRAVESSCFLFGRRSRPASLTLSLRGSAPGSRRHPGGSQNSSLQGSVAMETCDSHLSAASMSAPSAARDPDTLGSCDSDPPSPTEVTPLSSRDPTPSPSRNSARPLILGSSCDPTPLLPRSSAPLSSCDSAPSSPRDSSSPSQAPPSPPYDIITLPLGRNKFYRTPTERGAPIITHSNQETRGSQDAAVTPDQRPRLCQVTPGGRGFGFNLHCDRCREGQYIRSVDPGSPAERAGLLTGDRLIQVNGQRIEGLRHSEVVTLIRGCGRETSLLVVDPETDALFRQLGITPTTAHLKEDRVDGPMTTTPPPVPNGGPRPRTHGGPSSSLKLSGSSLDPGGLDADTQIFRGTASDPMERPERRRGKEIRDTDLHLSPTAAEARQKVRSGKAKKAAPPMTWSKKYEVFSNF